MQTTTRKIPRSNSTWEILRMCLPPHCLDKHPSSISKTETSTNGCTHHWKMNVNMHISIIPWSSSVNEWFAGCGCRLPNSRICVGAVCTTSLHHATDLQCSRAARLGLTNAERWMMHRVGIPWNRTIWLVVLHYIIPRLESARAS